MFSGVPAFSPRLFAAFPVGQPRRVEDGPGFLRVPDFAVLSEIARKNDWQKSGNQGSDAAFAKHATWGASRLLLAHLGKRVGFTNGIPTRRTAA